MRSLRLKLIVGSLLVLAAVILGFDAFFLLAKRSALLDILDGRLFAAAQALAQRLEIKDGKPGLRSGRRERGHSRQRRRPAADPDHGRNRTRPVPIVGIRWTLPGRRSRATRRRLVWKTVHSGRGRAWRTVTWVDRFEIDADRPAEKPPAAERRRSPWRSSARSPWPR